MNKLMLVVFAAVGASVLTGCTTYYRIEEVAPATAPVPVVSAPSVQVRARAVNAEATPLANHLKGGAESHLTGKGMVVMSRGTANMIVDLDVSRRETARLEDWRVYEGSVRAKMKSTPAPEAVLAERQFTATGKRGIDEAAAELGVRRSLESQVNAWLDETVVKVKIPAVAPAAAPGKPVSVTRMRILFKPDEPGADADDALEAQGLFQRIVQGRAGIMSCVLVRQNPAANEFEFEIAYDPGSYPDGLINTLILELKKSKLHLVHRR